MIPGKIHETDQRSVRSLIHARRDDLEQGIQRVNVVHGLVFSIVEHVERVCCALWSNNILPLAKLSADLFDTL